MKTFVRFIINLMLLAAFLTTAEALPGKDPDEYLFDQTLGDLSEELETAREDNKTGVLIFFERDECPFCHRMKTTVLNQPEVQDYFKKHFLILPVDIEGDVEITDFHGDVISQKDFAFKKNRVRATPVFAFFNLEGESIARYTGATRNAQEFLWLGEYVVKEIYKEKSFTRYKRERKSQQGKR